MTLYPKNITKNDRFGDFEIIKKNFSDENYSVFNIRNVNTNMHLCIEIPHSETGSQYLDFKESIIIKLNNNTYFRHIVQTKYPVSYPNILMLELLPPLSLQDLMKTSGKLKYSNFTEVLIQILCGVEDFYRIFGEYPFVSLENIYYAGSRILIDYVKSVSNVDFMRNFTEIILRLSDDSAFAERIIELLPVNFPDFNFEFLKTRLISLLGRDFSGKILTDNDLIVKCPKCNKEYFMSACICKQCGINLITGLKIEDSSNLKKQKKEGKNFTWIAVTSALIAIFVVFSKALGLSWLLWTIFSGAALTILIILFIFMLS